MPIKGYITGLNDAPPRRTDEEINAAILLACADSEVDKLSIMNKVYLSDHEATSYLSRLVADGLLAYSLGLKRYRITDAGLKVLNHQKG